MNNNYNTPFDWWNSLTDKEKEYIAYTIYRRKDYKHLTKGEIVKIYVKKKIVPQINKTLNF